MKELDYDIDNRDVNTTWLWIKNKAGETLGYIEVSIPELMGNALENNPGQVIDAEQV